MQDWRLDPKLIPHLDLNQLTPDRAGCDRYLYRSIGWLGLIERLAGSIAPSSAFDVLLFVLATEHFAKCLAYLRHSMPKDVAAPAGEFFAARLNAATGMARNLIEHDEDKLAKCLEAGEPGYSPLVTVNAPPTPWFEAVTFQGHSFDFTLVLAKAVALKQPLESWWKAVSEQP